MSVDLDSISDLIGIPFKNAGRDKSGCDCWGLVMLVYLKFGIELPDYMVSCMDSATIGRSVEASRSQWRRLVQPLAPCLVTMRLSPALPQFVTHLGVHVGDSLFLHTLKNRNSVLERLSHPLFQRKIEGFYEYVG